jgi:hypothetical protein
MDGPTGAGGAAKGAGSADVPAAANSQHGGVPWTGKYTLALATACQQSRGSGQCREYLHSRGSILCLF